MQQKAAAATPLTKDEFQTILTEALKNLRSEMKADNQQLGKDIRKEMNDGFVKVYIKIEDQKHEILDEAKQYRNDILTRMDADAKITEDEREERIFMEHKLQDHEKRITKLEHS